LNKKFRAAHKNVDREVARVQSAANELEKCLQRPSTIADLTLALDNVAEKLTQLKRKVLKQNVPVEQFYFSNWTIS